MSRYTSTLNQNLIGNVGFTVKSQDFTANVSELVKCLAGRCLSNIQYPDELSQPLTLRLNIVCVLQSHRCYHHVELFQSPQPGSGMFFYIITITIHCPSSKSPQNSPFQVPFALTAFLFCCRHVNRFCS